jgi:hypothetical protein
MSCTALAKAALSVRGRAVVCGRVAALDGATGIADGGADTGTRCGRDVPAPAALVAGAPGAGALAPGVPGPSVLPADPLAPGDAVRVVLAGLVRAFPGPPG